MVDEPLAGTLKHVCPHRFLPIVLEWGKSCRVVNKPRLAIIDGEECALRITTDLRGGPQVKHLEDEDADGGDDEQYSDASGNSRPLTHLFAYAHSGRGGVLA